MHHSCQPEFNPPRRHLRLLGVRGSHLDTALSRWVELGATGEEDEALCTPVSAPGVLDLVVLLAGVSAISNGENTVVELGAAGRVHDTASVHLENRLVGLDGDGDRLGDDGSLEGDLGVDRDVLVASDGGCNRLAGGGAGAVLGSVWVGRLGGDTLVLDDVLKAIVHQAAVAALVALGARAVDELLLGD